MECLQSGEFMHVSNAITVLREISSAYPLASVDPTAGAQLQQVMDSLCQTEKRGDLLVLARSYQATLKKREPFWAAPAVPQHVKVRVMLVFNGHRFREFTSATTNRPICEGFPCAVLRPC